LKKSLIIYYSYHHGNTEKIASAMSVATGAELCKLENISSKNLQDYEVIGLGAGIAFGKHYDKLLKGASQLDLRGKSVYVFSTSGTGGTNCHTALVELLNKAGATVVGNFGCKGFDTVGPFKLIGGIAKGHPDTSEIEAAKKFALEMVR